MTIDVEEAKRHAREALAKFDQREMGKLYNYAARLLGSTEEDAQELVNETLMRVLQGSRPYDPSRGAIKTFLGLQIRSLAILKRTEHHCDALDKQSRLQRPIENDEGDVIHPVDALACPRPRVDAELEERGSYAQSVERIRSAARRLSPLKQEHTEVLIRHLSDDEGTFRTAADEIGCSHQLLHTLAGRLCEMDEKYPQAPDNVHQIHFDRFWKVMYQLQRGAPSAMKACVRAGVRYHEWNNALSIMKTRAPAYYERYELTRRRPYKDRKPKAAPPVPESAPHPDLLPSPPTPIASEPQNNKVRVIVVEGAPDDVARTLKKLGVQSNAG